jgi:hypothetical protein
MNPVTRARIRRVVRRRRIARYLAVRAGDARTVQQWADFRAALHKPPPAAP